MGRAPLGGRDILLKGVHTIPRKRRTYALLIDNDLISGGGCEIFSVPMKGALPTIREKY